MLFRTVPALLLAAAAALPVAAETTPDYAARVLNAVNAYRDSRGLPRLEWARALQILAAEHSSAMAAYGRPSHDGFAGRFDRTAGTLCVENVAHGFRVPEQVIDGWRRISTHHRNLLEPGVRYVGVAADGSFVTYFACDSAD